MNDRSPCKAAWSTDGTHWTAANRQQMGLASIKYTAPQDFWSLSFSMATGNEPSAVAT